MKPENFEVRRITTYGNNNFNINVDIDITNENIDEVLKLLNLCVVNGWNFTRMLYDRYDSLSINQHFCDTRFTQTDLQEFLLNKNNRT